jgi:hypothetical protein
MTTSSGPKSRALASKHDKATNAAIGHNAAPACLGYSSPALKIIAITTMPQMENCDPTRSQDPSTTLTHLHRPRAAPTS